MKPRFRIRYCNTGKAIPEMFIFGALPDAFITGFSIVKYGFCRWYPLLLDVDYNDDRFTVANVLPVNQRYSCYTNRRGAIDCIDKAKAQLDKEYFEYIN